MTHADIITREGGPAAFGRPIEVPANTAKQWKRLNSIPSGYWEEIADKGLATLEELAAGAAAKRQSERAVATAD